MDFGTPQSRNEAILQNALGAKNELPPPQSRIEILLMALLEQLSGMKSVVRYIGVTTTELADGATTNPIVINDKSVTATNGDMVLYDGTAYAWDGTCWQQTLNIAEMITRMETLEAELHSLGLTVNNGKLCAVYNSN